MKIIKGKNQDKVRLDTLKSGDVFELNKKILMITDKKYSGTIMSIYLSNGLLESLEENKLVRIVKATMRVDY